LSANVEEKLRCCTCGLVDKTGLINGMCTDCYDLSLDIGKGFTKEQKRQLASRRRKALTT
jgi:NMD protein affecting ribosome stability and mRNA decay